MGLLSFLSRKKITESEEERESTSQFDPFIPKIRRVSEQVFTGQDLDEGTKDSDVFFRRLGTASIMDMNPNDIVRAQRLSIFLWRKNPRAWNMIELIKDFCVGDGVRIKAKDKKVQKLLDLHWKFNDWDEKLEERFRTLSLMGEQIYPVFVNKTSGLVRVSTISPFKLQLVIRNDEDAEDLVALRISKALVTGHVGGTVSAGAQVGGAFKTLDLIKMDVDGKLKGEVFYFAVNRASGGTRGMPDMTASIDWLEGMDNYVFSLLERAELSQDIVFDLTYQHLGKDDLRKKGDEFVGALRSGGVFTHNEGVTLEIKSPKLEGSDAKEVVSIMMKQIQSGTRLAGLFYGDSDDLTRAAASELTTPVAKALQGRQNFIRRMLTKILDFQLQKFIEAGELKESDNLEYELLFPRIFMRDMSLVTKALKQLSESLQLAEENNWLSRDEAAAVYRTSLEQLGNVLDPNIDPTAAMSEEEQLIDQYDN